jgi:hypothetical protein
MHFLDFFMHRMSGPYSFTLLDDVECRLDSPQQKIFVTPDFNECREKSTRSCYVKSEPFVMNQLLGLLAFANYFEPYIHTKYYALIRF